MLPFNTMRYVTDTFYFETPSPKTALLVSKVPIDTNGYISVKSINISGAEPAGTLRRFMLKFDNKIYRFLNGSLSQYSGEINVDNVLADGNSAAELAAISDCSTLLNKQIFPIIALRAPANGLVRTYAKFSISVYSRP